MASIEEIKKAKELAITKLNEKIENAPNIGLFEFMQAELSSFGVDCANVQNKEELKKAVRQLSHSQKKILKEDFENYQRVYSEAIKDVHSGVYSKALALPKSLVSTVTHGAIKGMGVAGVVNTVAPGLFPTLAGYIAGSSIIDSSTLGVLAKLGLVSAGVFTPTAITQGGIIAIGAVTGAVVYSAGKLVTSTVKGLHRKIQKRAAKKHRDKEI